MAMFLCHKGLYSFKDKSEIKVKLDPGCIGATEKEITMYKIHKQKVVSIIVMAVEQDQKNLIIGILLPNSISFLISQPPNKIHKYSNTIQKENKI